MTFEVAIVQQNAPTSTGNQSYTRTDFPTAKAAIVIVTAATTSGTKVDGIELSYGYTDISDERCTSVCSEHNQGTSDTGRAIHDSLVEVRDSTSTNQATVLWQASINGTVTGGIQLNWTTVQGSGAPLVTVIMFGGTDVQAFLLNDQLPSGTTTVYNTVGFEADFLFLMTCYENGEQGNQLIWSRGLVHNDRAGGITHRCHGVCDVDGQGTTEGRGNVTEAYGLAQVTASGSQTISRVSFESFGSSGFTARENNTNPSSRMFSALCLRLNGGLSTGILDIDTPNSTGDDAYTGLGFTPGAAFGIMGLNTSAGNGVDATNQFSGSFMLLDDADVEATVAFATEDGAGTSNCETLVDNQILNQSDHDGTLALAATVTSKDASGLTLNYTTTTNGLNGYLACFEVPAAGGNAPRAMHQYRRRRIA